MASITLRTLKGSPLTITEMDDNFSNINLDLTEKLYIPSNPLTSTAETGLTITTNTSGSTRGRSIDVSGTGLTITNANGINGNPTITLNSSTTNLQDTIVARDTSGNFEANTITASLVGNVTGNVSGTSSSITSVLPISLGGTGGNSAHIARTNILPATPQNSAGYILKTDGSGNFYWGAQTGNVTTAGTRIDSQRIYTTATANQTVFTTPTYVPGANQLRVYLDGVRQFDSDYSEDTTTQITFFTGISAGVEVMIEVDGYIDYDIAASEVSYSPSGSMNSTNVQDAIDEIHADTNNLGTMSSQNASSVNISGGSIGSISVTSIGTNSYNNRTFSTSDPTGGVDGDIWYKYIA